MSLRPTPKQRRAVEARAQWRCEYCLTPLRFSPQSFNVDHVIPRSLGGLIRLNNLALACGCNQYKANRVRAYDPQTRRLVSLFNPRRQAWEEHFTWSADALQIIGLTAVGRATIAALRLNRDELINLRHLLILIGEHPP